MKEKRGDMGELCGCVGEATRRMGEQKGGVGEREELYWGRDGGCMIEV